MKKTNVIKGAVAVLAAAAFFASCAPSTGIDTIETLGTPSVKAVAYPGINYVTWEAVKGAQSYTVTKTIDNVETLVSTKETLVSNGTALYETDMVNTDAVEVTYKVYANSNTDPSRAVCVYGSNAGSATVKAIFPAAGTKATDLPKYEKDSKYNFEDESKNAEWKDDYIPAAGNIKVTAMKGKIAVTYPTKAYLSTEVKAYNGGKVAVFANAAYKSVDATEIYNNKTATKVVEITGAGKYTFKAEVSALNDAYVSDKFDVDATYTVPELDVVTATGTPVAKYVDEGKKVRVTFTPATKNDASVYPVANYAVYRTCDADPVLTKVGEVKADAVVGEDTYYVDDEIANNKIDYTYYVVLSEGEEFEAEKTATLAAYNVGAATGSTASFSYATIDDDAIANDVILTVNAAANEKIVSVKYTVVSDKKDVASILDSELKEVLPAAPNSVDTVNGTAYAYVIKNIPENSYAYALVEYADITDAAKKTKTVKASSSVYTSTDVATGVTINVGAPATKAKSTDLLANDFKDISVKLANKDQKITKITYAVGETAAVAKTNAVLSTTAITVKTPDYVNYPNDYTFSLDDIAYNKYLAVAVTVEEVNKAPTTFVAASTSATSLSFNRSNAFDVSTPREYGATTNSLSVQLDKTVDLASDAYANYAVKVEYAKTATGVSASAISYDFGADTVWTPVTVEVAKLSGSDTTTEYYQGSKLIDSVTRATGANVTTVYNCYVIRVTTTPTSAALSAAEKAAAAIVDYRTVMLSYER